MRTKIYTVHENTKATDPADRVELVREGFSLGAFALTGFWLMLKRLWLETAAFLLLIGMLSYAAKVYGLSPEGTALMQLLVSLVVGFGAHDLERAALTRRGYRMAGVIAAENELAATRRYYDTVAA